MRRADHYRPGAARWRHRHNHLGLYPRPRSEPGRDFELLEPASKTHCADSGISLLKRAWPLCLPQVNQLSGFRRAVAMRRFTNSSSVSGIVRGGALAVACLDAELRLAFSSSL